MRFLGEAVFMPASSLCCCCDYVNDAVCAEHVASEH